MAKTVVTARIVLDGAATKWEEELFENKGTSPEDAVARMQNLLGAYSTEGVRMQVQLFEAEETAATATVQVSQSDLVNEEVSLWVSVPGSNAVRFTALTSGADTSDFEFNIGSSDSEAATNLAAAINGSYGKYLSAEAASDTVTLTSVGLGSHFNNIKLKDLTAAPAFTLSEFSGGVDVLEEQEEVTITVDASAATAGTTALSIGNFTFTGVTAGDDDTELEWTIDLSESTDALDDAATARELAAAINGHSVLGGLLTASVPAAGAANDNVVTITPTEGASPEMVAFLEDMSVAGSGLTLSTNKKFDGTLTYTNRRANTSYGTTVR